ncbi:hypothetical protein E4U21_000587 [Claviceps maximensis]|nr:hypothetical protein E4U21_000587 [Claviceps maximensis]
MEIWVPRLLLAWCLIGSSQARDITASSPLTKSSSSTPSSDSFKYSQYLEHLPACGAACLNASITADICANTTSCVCSDQPSMDRIQGCLVSSCTFSEELGTKNMTEAFCGRPPRDRSLQYNATSIALCVVTGILVLMRLTFKQWFSYQRQLNLDDLIIMISVLVGLPCTILNTTGLTHNGLGKDAWTLHASDLVEFARYFFVQQILYLFLMTTIKLSLLCFYLTIFPNKRVRVLLWSTIAVNLAWGFACIMVTVFQCRPVQNYWLRYLQRELGGQCLDMNLMGWANGAVSVVIDIWIIGIPLYQMRKLDLNWRKKIGAVIMFLTGAFVTIVSILRLQSLVYFYNSPNPTWDLWFTAWWSTIEINVGLMCACLPTVRVLLVRMWPNVFGSGSTTHSSSWSSRSQHVMAERKPARIDSLEVRLVDAPRLPKHEKRDDERRPSPLSYDQRESERPKVPPKNSFSAKDLHKSLPPLPPREQH